MTLRIAKGEEGLTGGAAEMRRVGSEVLTEGVI